MNEMSIIEAGEEGNCLPHCRYPTVNFEIPATFVSNCRYIFTIPRIAHTDTGTIHKMSLSSFANVGSFRLLYVAALFNKKEPGPKAKKWCVVKGCAMQSLVTIVTHIVDGWRML